MGMIRRAPFFVAAAIALLVPSIALAEDSDPVQQTTKVVLLLVSVGVAYLLTHLVVGRLQRAFLVVTGVEYVLLGVLLGPVVALVPAFSELSGLLPIIALATGWVGLLRGIELSTAALREAPRGTRRLALFDDLLAGGFVATAAYFLLSSGFLGAFEEREIWLASGFLGCGAATRATAPIDIVVRRYKVEGPTEPLLRLSARMGDAIALFVYGMLFAFFHEKTAGVELQLGPISWMALALGVGMALGLIFRPFLGKDDSEGGRFLAIVGIITFASGAAWFLQLSPVFVTLVLGIVLVNISPAGAEIHTTLVRTSQPMTLILLIFAGAVWEIPPLVPTAALLPVFLVLRFAGKWLASRFASVGGLLRRDLWRGQLAHGNAALAMGISFKLVFDGPAIDAVYTIVLVSILLHNLIAPRLLRRLLADSGELKRELEG
jgi:hypothetical protein